MIEIIIISIITFGGDITYMAQGQKKGTGGTNHDQDHDHCHHHHHNHHNQPVVVTLKLLVQGQTKAVEEESKEFLEEKEIDTPVE